MAKMIIVSGDDWTGVYVDGELQTEGHSIPAIDAVEIAIEKKVTEVERKECDFDWLFDEGNLPEKLENVKWS